MFFEKERDGKNDKEGGYMREKKWVYGKNDKEGKNVR